MSQAKDEAGYLRRPFWFAHLIWAVVGLAASAFLIVYGGEGHPPGIILLPVVWILWALGHGGNDQKHLNWRCQSGPVRCEDPEWLGGAFRLSKRT